jgi:DNA-binding NarL/FixJ family response regulator
MDVPNPRGPGGPPGPLDGAGEAAPANAGGGRPIVSPAPLKPRAAALPGSAELVAHALAAIGLAAVVCDAKARVLAVTPAARSALTAGGLQLIGGRLRGRRADAPELDAAIAAATSAVAAGEDRTPPPVVVRHGRDPTRFQVLDVIGFSATGRGPAAEPRAIVLLRGSTADPADVEDVLVRAYRLTSAEAQVAARLALGEARETIAARRGSSLQTVRTQIRTIFAKLGVTRERELAARVRQIVGR